MTPQALAQPLSTKEYLIGIPAPREPLDLSPDLRGASPSRMLHEVAGRQAQPLLDELQRLQLRGEILAYELDPAQFAVRVTAAGELPLLDEGVSYAVAAEDGPPSCAVGLPEAMTAAARATIADEALDPMRPRGATAGPTLNISVRAPYAGEYARVSGSTEPNVSVQMRVWRNGSLYLTWYNESNDNGYYEMYPYWDSCPRGGYMWYLQPDDVVEITAAGKTSRTTVAPIVASLDPMTGQIFGQTAPNREIRGWLDFMMADECYWDNEAWYSQSGADGRFTADVSGIDGPDRRSSATVYVVDSNGHTTYSYADAFSINTELGYNGVWMTVNRGVSGVARLSRGGQQISSETFISDATGYAWIYFYDADLMPGDVITVQDGRLTMTTTLASAGLSLDATQNRLVGTTTPGYEMTAGFYARSDSYDAIRTSCEWQYGCGRATAAANGAISIPAQFDLLPGDYTYPLIYDPEGNRQYMPTLSAPTLAASPGLPFIRGYWARPYTDIVIRLYAPDNSLKRETTDYSSYDGEIAPWLGVQALAGDRIEATDGIRTLSMVIPDAGARLNSIAQALTIHGPSRPYLATYWDQAGRYSAGQECFDGNISGGQTSIDLAGRVTAQDGANVFIRGADDNYLFLPLSAFTVYVIQNSPYVDVYGETAGAEVSLIQRRGGSVINQESDIADALGYAYFSISTDLLAGDTVEIDVNDGTSADITLTPLTALVNPANNSIYGVAPANHDLATRLIRSTPYSTWIWNVWGEADSSGRYETEIYTDWYWGGDWREPCLNVFVDDRCAVPSVRYWTNLGHTVSLAYAAPSGASADSFENDDTAATAKLHPGGTRTHTFHTNTDVDWVKVTIPPWAVGRPVTFRVSNMGWGVNVDMILYRQNGTTVAPGQEMFYSENETLLRWEPDVAGTVLLRMAPMDEYAAGHCDAYYDLRLDLAQVALPAIVGR